MKQHAHVAADLHASLTVRQRDVLAAYQSSGWLTVFGVDAQVVDTLIRKGCLEYDHVRAKVRTPLGDDSQSKTYRYLFAMVGREPETVMQRAVEFDGVPTSKKWNLCVDALKTDYKLQYGANLKDIYVEAEPVHEFKEGRFSTLVHWDVRDESNDTEMQSLTSAGIDFVSTRVEALVDALLIHAPGNPVQAWNEAFEKVVGESIDMGNHLHKELVRLAAGKAAKLDITEKQIHADSPWVARGFVLPGEVAALRESAKTALSAERLTTSGNSAALTLTRDALFDGSNAHLLNNAGDAFESGPSPM